MRDYKKYEIWKKAHEITLSIYQKTSNFPDSEKFGLTNQIRRSASSIAINIVEGSSRKSDKEFRHFLFISASSAGETEYILKLCTDLSLIDKDIGATLIDETNHLRRMIYNFIKKIS